MRTQADVWARTLGALGSDRGATLLEFALVLPLLIVLIVGAIDYGGAANLATKLKSAARAGGQYAVYHAADTCGILNAVSNAVNDTSGTMTIQLSDSTATLKTLTSKTCAAATAYYCTCGNSQVTKSNPTVDCAAGLCTSPSYKNFFVAVSVTQTYSPPLIVASLPIIHATGTPSGSGLALTGSSVIQFQ